MDAHCGLSRDHACTCKLQIRKYGWDGIKRDCLQKANLLTFILRPLFSGSFPVDNQVHEPLIIFDKEKRFVMSSLLE